MNMSSGVPTVSVLMTAFNRENYIADAISSVLASDFSDFELIVVDDGSSDRTVEIARELEAGDSRVRVFQNAENLGDYPNRNHAASLARGTYLKYVDSDDMVYPWSLGVMVRCISSFPEAGLALAAIAESSRPHPQQLTPAEAYERHFLERDLFGRAPGSAIIRRAAFEQVGGFSGRRQVGDLEFWLKICATHNVVTMPVGLTWDRVHEAQEKNLDSQAEKEALSIELVTQAILNNDCPLSDTKKRQALGILLKKYRRKFYNTLFIRKNIPESLIIKRKSIPLIRLSIENLS